MSFDLILSDEVTDFLMLGLNELLTLFFQFRFKKFFKPKIKLP